MTPDNRPETGPVWECRNEHDEKVDREVETQGGREQRRAYGGATSNRQRGAESTPALREVGVER